LFAAIAARPIHSTDECDTINASHGITAFIKIVIVLVLLCGAYFLCIATSY
jgi:hypothetical protein